MSLIMSWVFELRVVWLLWCLSFRLARFLLSTSSSLHNWQQLVITSVNSSYLGLGQPSSWTPFPIPLFSFWMPFNPVIHTSFSSPPQSLYWVIYLPSFIPFHNSHSNLNISNKIQSKNYPLFCCTHHFHAVENFSAYSLNDPGSNPDLHSTRCLTLWKIALMSLKFGVLRHDVGNNVYPEKQFGG